jgi:hypothetical protein
MLLYLFNTNFALFLILCHVHVWLCEWEKNETKHGKLKLCVTRFGCMKIMIRMESDFK